MRARMALKQANIEVETREISLRTKPSHMLQMSPKGTVPVLVLPNNTVLEQSLEIMYWALQRQDIDCWLLADAEFTQQLITENDHSFTQALNHYKYPERYIEKRATDYRAEGEVFLQKLETLLIKSNYLLSEKISLADIAIFPFIRQFSAVDSSWFEIAPYPKLRAWLRRLVNSELFEAIMKKQPTYIE